MAGENRLLQVACVCTFAHAWCACMHMRTHAYTFFFLKERVQKAFCKTWSFRVAQTMPPHLFGLRDFFLFNFKIHDRLFLF